MRLAGGCIFAVLCLIVCSAVPAAAQLTATCSPQCYGPGIGSDGLANTTVGPNGNTVSYRFRAGHTGSVGKIHIYLIPDRTGYAAGTGGQIQITVNADDDTAAHNPSSTVLASYLLSNPLTATPSRYFPIITFVTPPSLVAGRLYHIVFKNVDASPSVNYLSVDALYLAHPTTPSQPTISDIDGAELLRTSNQAWQPRKGYLPILQLDFTDGWTEGTGYMEVWIGAPQAISGNSAVREQFTVAGTQKDITGVAVRVARISGSDPLKVRLQDGNGNLIEEGNIPAASFTTSLSYVWAQYKFTSARSLLPGKTYFLELAAASTSSYQAFPIRKGGDYNFAKTTYFPEGFAQFKLSTAWTGWTQWGVTNRLDSDLQFYFEVGAIGSAPAISNVAATATSTGATVTWTTDQASSSQVEYGTTSSYGSMTALNSTLVASHSQSITGLTPGTLYHYRVRSAPSSGTVAVSSDFTFTTDTVPPVISAVAAGSITSNSSTVSWSTDQAADGQVEYGTTTGYGSSTTMNPAMATSHAQVLGGLSPGTLYHYRVRSSNNSGDLTMSGDETFTTSSVPPVISGVAAGSINSSGAMVSWNTDQAANGQVEYGVSTTYGNSTTLNLAMAISHAQALSGLAWGTLYHYRVRSTNSWGDLTVSSDATFTTATVPPAISGVAAGSITANGAVVSWSTDQAASGQVEYGTSTAYGSATTLNSTMGTSHAQNLIGLAAGTLYHYRVRSTNSWDDLAVSGDATFTTATIPPMISGVSAGSITATEATIGWITDQSSSSQVEYGTTTTYGTSTAVDATMVTSHSQTLPSLAAGTTYHYRVRSTNTWGNQAVSADSTFTTASAPVNGPAAVSCAAGCYGTGMAADALSSAVVGGAAGNVVSYRFRAKHSGSLDRIHFYMLPDVAGYAGGTGGKIQITVNTDDGTPAHNPTATVLASSLVSNPVTTTPSKYFPIISFPALPPLASGRLYHIVFTNVDASPATNYLSISSLYQPTAPTPAQPSISDTDSAQLLRTAGGSWAPRKGYTPILELDYKDGVSEGTGYMEVWVGAPRPISGTNAVRETFTVTGTQKTVKIVAVRVARLGGTDALTLRLEDGAGNLIEQRDILASSIPVTSPISYTWVGFTLSTPRTLVPGQTYHLVLQAASSSSYQAYPIRKGLAYNFQNSTYFADGFAQFKATTSWAGWTQWGVADRTDSDLQFYFGF